MKCLHCTRKARRGPLPSLYLPFVLGPGYSVLEKWVPVQHALRQQNSGRCRPPGRSAKGSPQPVLQLPEVLGTFFLPVIVSFYLKHCSVRSQTFLAVKRSSCLENHSMPAHRPCPGKAKILTILGQPSGRM